MILGATAAASATASADVVVIDMIVAALHHHKARSRKGAQPKATRRARGVSVLRCVDR